jgi:phosphoribosylanthranilate isomerase
LAAVKICGVTSMEDAILSERAGASYVGMVISKGHLRSVSLDFVRDVASILSSSRPVVVITDRVALGNAIGSGLDVIIQLHLEDLSIRDLEIVVENGYRAIPVTILRNLSKVDIDQKVTIAKEFAEHVEYLLIDLPKNRARYSDRDNLELPIDLYIHGCSRYRPCGVAGGIRPENVARLKHVAPDVIDVSSGVERSPGKKDPEKVRKLVEVARNLSKIY